MKYVIKEASGTGSPAYIIATSPLQSGFFFTETLADATKYTSVANAVNAIAERTTFVVWGNTKAAPSTKFTIVGVEEVSTPSYKEVLL